MLIAKLLFIYAIILVVLAVALFKFSRNSSMQKKLLALVLFVAFTAPLLPLSYYHYHLSVFEFLQEFTNNLAEAFGISSKLGIAAAVLLTIPFLTVCGMIFSASKSRRTLAIALMSLGIASYYVILWAGTRDHLVSADGSSIKCYTIAQDGVRFFEREQFDPKTGEKCVWIDPSNAKRILAIDKKLKSGEPVKQLAISDPSDAVFFMTGTSGSIPIVWYYQASDGSFEFFDAPGFHPTFGAALKPVSEDIVKAWIEFEKQVKERERLALEEKRQEEEEEEEEALLAEEEARKEKARLVDERERSNRISSTKQYFMSSAVGSEKSGFAVSVIEKKGVALGEGSASDYFRRKLEELPGASKLSFPFRSRFSGSSLQEMIWAGSYDDLIEADFFKLYPKIVLIMISPDCQKKASGAGEVVACTISVEVRIGANDGLMRQRRFQAKSAAFSEEIAVGRGIDELYAGDLVTMLGLEG